MNELSRRRVGRMLGAGTLAVVVVGGVGFTAVRVTGADRDAGKPVWKFSATAKDDQSDRDEQGSKDPSGLRGLLQPYGEENEGYGPGPDLGEFGPNAVLGGRQATALEKQEIHDMPPQARRKLDELIDKKHIQGMAMRSYAPQGYQTKDSVISVELVRMENQAAVRNLSNNRRELLKAFGIFPKGPVIKGHGNASCFLMPKVGDSKIDRMFCTAYAGDVLVTINASGPRPLGNKRVAGFVGQQLDRIKDPGKAV